MVHRAWGGGCQEREMPYPQTPISGLSLFSKQNLGLSTKPFGVLIQVIPICSQDQKPLGWIFKSIFFQFTDYH
jgi:hypothetical protein